MKIWSFFMFFINSIKKAKSVEKFLNIIYLIANFSFCVKINIYKVYKSVLGKRN